MNARRLRKSRILLTSVAVALLAWAGVAAAAPETAVNVADASESIVNSMDRITQLYERLAR